jgi:DNA-binding SARP family transcriptional activator
LLGGFELRCDGEGLALATRKAEALLALLALRPGQAFARDTLCGLLWPDVRDEQARHSLRQTLHGMRKTLAGVAPKVLRADARSLALDPERVIVDVAGIETRLEVGSHAALSEAAIMYRGNLLDGMSVDEPPFQNWLTFERERLRGSMAIGLSRLVELQTQVGDLNAASQSCAQWLQLDPLHEEAHRALMRLHLRQGRRAAALQHYRSFEQTLRAEIGAEPEELTRKLYAELEVGADAVGCSSLTTNVPAVRVERVYAAPTVGREAELLGLHTALEHGQGSALGVCLLIGEAGVGKTHLCERLATEISDRGTRVLRGRCFESEQVLPFSLWANLLTSARLLEDTALLSALPRALQSELTCFLPQPDDGESLSTTRDVLRLFRAMQALVSRLADRAPLLLVLEDLHWADEMSLRLLCFLARSAVGAQHGLLLATARQEELSTSPFMRNALAELDREQLLKKVELSPLSRTQSCDLASALLNGVEQATLSRDLFDQMWTISEGNPLVIVEVTRALAEGALERGVAQLPVPERVRALIRGRVLRASASAREVLSFAAVAGRELELGLLRCGSMSETELMAAIEELVEAHLVRALEDRIYFTHDRIRETLYAELLPARRRWLHARVADALQTHGAGRLDSVLGSIGYHCSKAGDAERAVDFLVRFAAKECRGHGVGEALAALDQALADCARFSSRRNETAIEIVIEQAFCLACLGRFPELVARLQEYLPCLEGLNDVALSVSFHFWWGFGLTLMGELEEAERHANRSLRFAVAADDSRGMGYAHCLLANLCGATGRFQRGIEHGTTATDLLDSIEGIPEARSIAWICLGMNRLYLGDWRGALVAGLAAQAVGDAADSDRVRSLAASNIGYVYAYSRQSELALCAARSGLEASNDPFTLAQALISSAYAHVVSGRVQEAIAIAEPLIAQLELHGMQAFGGQTLGVLAEAWLRAGEPKRAREMAAKAAHIAQLTGDRHGLGMARRLEGQAALRLGELPAARDQLAEALQAFESFGARIEIADTLLACSELATVESNRPLAHNHLERARSLYVACDIAAGDERTDTLLASN